MYREIEALGGAVVMDDYDEGYSDGLCEALAILRKYGFGVDLAPVAKEEIVMIDDGGPAYPAKLRTGKIVVAEEPIEGYPYVTQPVVAEEVKDHHGMSLRDYLAGQVIGPLVITTDAATRSTRMPYPEAVTYVAKLAYDVADAMLAARKAAA